MARIVLTNMLVTVGGTDLSAFITSATLETTVEAVSTTAMSSAGLTSQIALKIKSPWYCSASLLIQLY